MHPRLLLLDEPLASLDSARKAKILPYLVQLRDEVRIPMVYVSHHAREIRHMANAVVVIEDGRIISQGGPDILDRASAEIFT